MKSLRPLVRHFLGSLLGRGVLQDDGVEAVRGLFFWVVAGLLSVGWILPRHFSRVYLELSYLLDPEPFRRAMTADSMFMLTLPFLLAMIVAAVVAPSMFPDEVDYLTLVPLPLTRRRIFAAKIIALTLFVGVLLLSLSLFSAIAFPMFTHRRWVEGSISQRIFAHGLAAALSGGMGFGLVLAIQGLGSMWAPRRWVPRLSVIVPSTVITAAILAVPFVLQLPTQRMWVATEPSVLAFFPPAWFAGLERVLLGIATPYWQRLAWLGLFGTAAVIAGGALSYVWLYRRFERLVLPPPRETHIGLGPGRITLPHMGVWQFSRATLLRNRLPLLLFLVFSAIGVGLVTWSLLAGFLHPTFRWDEPAPPPLLAAVIGLPLVLMLTGLTGLRTAFLLPVQSRANWIFRMTDGPLTRARHLAAVDHACLRLVLIPAMALAVPLQVWVIGIDAWRTSVLSLLAGLAMAELMLIDWRRVPFTCTWIPGRMPLVVTIVLAAGVYILVTGFLATFLQFALFSLPVFCFLAGILLIITATARHRRQQSWASQPLQFEDEPFQLQTLGLR
jgi:hypothetical protein